MFRNIAFNGFSASADFVDDKENSLIWLLQNCPNAEYSISDDKITIEFNEHIAHQNEFYRFYQYVGTHAYKILDTGPTPIEWIYEPSLDIMGKHGEQIVMVANGHNALPMASGYMIASIVAHRQKTSHVTVLDKMGIDWLCTQPVGTIVWSRFKSRSALDNFVHFVSKIDDFRNTEALLAIYGKYYE